MISWTIPLDAPQWICLNSRNVKLLRVSWACNSLGECVATAGKRHVWRSMTVPYTELCTRTGEWQTLTEARYLVNTVTVLSLAPAVPTVLNGHSAAGSLGFMPERDGFLAHPKKSMFVSSCLSRTVHLWILPTCKKPATQCIPLGLHQFPRQWRISRVHRAKARVQDDGRWCAQAKRQAASPVRIGEREAWGFYRFYPLLCSVCGILWIEQVFVTRSWF